LSNIAYTRHLLEAAAEATHLLKAAETRLGDGFLAYTAMAKH
jgi:hypothetical protein